MQSWKQYKLVLSSYVSIMEELYADGGKSVKTPSLKNKFSRFNGPSNICIQNSQKKPIKFQFQKGWNWNVWKFIGF